MTFKNKKKKPFQNYFKTEQKINGHTHKHQNIREIQKQNLYQLFFRSAVYEVLKNLFNKGIPSLYTYLAFC